MSDSGPKQSEYAAPTVEEWFSRRRREVDARISTHLKLANSERRPHGGLLDAVQYSLEPGGKRFRAILVLECCRICGGEDEAAWPVALALECVHAFSLIHDDLPAMDDDELRRGRPTTHIVFGEAAAILAGDWLLAYGFGLLASENVDRALRGPLAAALATGTLAMIAGQAADLAGEGKPPDPQLVLEIHLNKTAALIETSCRLGALAARARPDAIERLACYGRHLGLAFQIADDLLDVESTAEASGKRTGKDAGRSKQTYPAAFGAADARRQAQAEVGLAIAALEEFGPTAQHLRNLASFAVTRST